MNNIFINSIYFIFIVSYSWAAPNPVKIVNKADSIRGPKRPFSFLIKVFNYRKEKLRSKITFKTDTYDRVRSLLVYTSPPRDKGKKILMVRENIWIYIPTSKRPIRITPQQKLMGQVSYGDIARTNFGQDYTPSLISKEKLEGAMAWKLELIKKTKAATYYRIIYWVNSANYHPIKAEFYSRTGRLMKIAHFKKYRMEMGRLRPTLLTIRNAILKKERSEIFFYKYRPSRLSKAQYQKSRLSR